MQATATRPAHHDPHAWHAAFEELDLACEWNPSVHGAGREGLRAWLQMERPHLLRVYDADFLLNALEATRQRLDRSR